MKLLKTKPNHNQPWAGVIGNPISHSLSPLIHQQWLNDFGLLADYRRVQVLPEELQSFLQNLPQTNCVGVNVTVPHKVAVIPFLNDIDAAAVKIGAVNTIVVQANNTLKGYNTDYLGFMAGLNHLPKPTATDKVLLLGAGGAARAVVVALDVLGYKNLVICNRDTDKAKNLAQIWPHAIEIAAWDSRHQYLAQAQLIINSTSLGMVGQPPLELHWPNQLQKNAVAYDLVYQPLATEFLLAAQKLGCQTIDGLTMLIAQAAPAFEKFFGHTPPEGFKALRQIILDFLAQKAQEPKV